jgi:hypothetical protein
MAPRDDDEYVPTRDDEQQALEEEEAEDDYDDEAHEPEDDPAGAALVSALLISERGENLADVLTRLEATIDGHLAAINKTLASLAKTLKAR